MVSTGGEGREQRAVAVTHVKSAKLNELTTLLLQLLPN